MADSGSTASLAESTNPVTAYVVNSLSGTVTPIATATNTAGPTITVASEPQVIAITPDAKTAYVSGFDSSGNGSGTVTPITTATNTAGPPITVGNSQPSYIAITPDGKTAYAANPVLPDSVTPIATATNTAGTPIGVGSIPTFIAITPDGRTAYVTDEGSSDYGPGTVTPITTATNTAGPPITVGSQQSDPGVIAITPDGETAYVADGGADTVTPIATATNTAGPPITVGEGPADIAITPDGKTAYVSNYGSGTVTPIETATNTAGPPITVGSHPDAIAITPDGNSVYVASYGSGTVTPIATATNTAGPPITVGSGPVAIAITPATSATVTKEPIFTSGTFAAAAFGVAFTFTVTAIGNPIPVITKTGRLPAGMKFARTGHGTATISGTPAKTAGGAYPMTLTAKNKNGTATQAFTLTVTRAPAIKDIRTVRVSTGATLSLTVQATGFPAPTLTEAGPLPAGLSFADNGNGTAVIAGTVGASSAGGRYPVTITATNASGTASRHFKIIVS